MASTTTTATAAACARWKRRTLRENCTGSPPAIRRWCSPESRFLAWGGRDPFVDLENQRRLDQKVVSTGVGLASRLACGKNRVHGELLSFADSVGRLRAIDALEEFRPGHKCRYERVLIQVYSPCHQADVLAWTYVAGSLSPQRRLIPTGKWAG